MMVQHLLMKVLSHPGQGISQRCIVDNWTYFSFTSRPGGFLARWVNRKPHTGF